MNDTEVIVSYFSKMEKLFAVNRNEIYFTMSLMKSKFHSI